MVGQNVRAEQSVDGHICILLGKWPMADRYNAHCKVERKKNRIAISPNTQATLTFCKMQKEIDVYRMEWIGCRLSKYKGNGENIT